MTIDATNGRVAFPEIGLVVDGALTRTVFLRLPVAANSKAGTSNGPWSRYQLPVVPQRDTELYVVLQFHGERLASLELFHSAARFGTSWEDWSESGELARKAFHERWLASEFGLTCRRYRWGEISSNYDAKGGSSTLRIAYAESNSWRTLGRTAGRWWGAAASRL